MDAINRERFEWGPSARARVRLRSVRRCAGNRSAVSIICTRSGRVACCDINLFDGAGEKRPVNIFA